MNKLFYIAVVVLLIKISVKAQQIRTADYLNSAGEVKYTLTKKALLIWKDGAPSLYTTCFSNGDTLFIGTTCAWKDTMYRRDNYLMDSKGNKFYRK